MFHNFNISMQHFLKFFESFNLVIKFAHKLASCQCINTGPFLGWDLTSNDPNDPGVSKGDIL